MMTIPNTTYNKVCWAVLRVSTALWILSVALFLVGLLASVAGAQEHSFSAVTIDGSTYTINRIGFDGWSQTYISGPGGSSTGFSMDLGQGYSSTYISSEPGDWGYTERESDFVKGLMVLESTRSDRGYRDGKPITTAAWWASQQAYRKRLISPAEAAKIKARLDD